MRAWQMTEEQQEHDRALEDLLRDGVELRRRAANPGVHHRKSDTAMIAIAITVALQLGGIIWGASKMDSALGELSAVTTELKVNDVVRLTAIQNLMERVRILEIKREEDDRSTRERSGESRQRRVQ